MKYLSLDVNQQSINQIIHSNNSSF